MIYFFKRYYKHILIAIGLVFIFVSGYIYYDSTNSVTTVNKTKLSVEKNIVKKGEKNEYNTLFVDVKGSVNNPGVYEMDVGKRVIDAINLAGGLTENADTINLNLSKKLSDEMYIVVYSKEEIYSYNKNSKQDNEEITCASQECVCPDVKNDACINTQGNVKNDNTKEDNQTSKEKVSINKASKEELMNLSGIGETKAEAIISYRNENGNFKNIEDIKNVSGIGEAVFEKIKDNITI